MIRSPPGDHVPMPELTPRPPIADAPLSIILLAAASTSELEEVVAAWSALLVELGRTTAEIILVPYGTPLRPDPMSDSLVSRFPRLRWLSETQSGVGAALQAGILAAQFPLVVFAPADKQFQPAELKRLLGEIDKVDLVTGYRVDRPAPAWLEAIDFGVHWLARIFLGYQTERRDSWLGWSGWGRRWLARWVFGLQVTDAECVFRLARREIFRRIPIHSLTRVAHLEILAKANHLGVWMAQVPLSWIPPKQMPAEPGAARQERAELMRLFKHPDFSPVALKEPFTWTAPIAMTPEPTKSS